MDKKLVAAAAAEGVSRLETKASESESTAPVGMRKVVPLMPRMASPQESPKPPLESTTRADRRAKHVGFALDRGMDTATPLAEAAGDARMARVDSASEAAEAREEN